MPKQITNIIIYALIAASTLLFLTITMKLWQADLAVPFEYGGDTLATSEWVRSAMDNPWYLTNKYRGMPDGTEMHDYPMADNLHILIMKIFSFFSMNFALVMNVYFILTFLLAACISFYVFRKLGVTPPLAYAGGILFAFMPYHFVQGVCHVFLSGYYLIPLTVMVMLWVFNGELSFGRQSNAISENDPEKKKKTVISLVVCILVPAAGIYYAFFACFFAIVSGAFRSVYEKKMAPMVTGGAIALLITIGGLFNISPTLIYSIQHGRNPEAIPRVMHETELYSLKISSMLMPISGHRITLLSNLKKQFVKETSFIYRFENAEAEGASLGLIASAGFVFLILFFFIDYVRPGVLPVSDWLKYLSIFVMAALLITTVGSFNTFISILLRFKIRSYNRISIYIAFFSLFAVLVGVQYLINYVLNSQSFRLRFNDEAKAKRISMAVVCFSSIILIGIGLFDQTGYYPVCDFNKAAEKYLHDKYYIAKIESMMPSGSMIYQLPYYPYPETIPPYRMELYDHFRGYLNSKSLRWSYGVIKGRPTDLWQRKVAGFPTEDMIKEIKSKGFTGLYININGYKDHAAALMKEVEAITKEKPLVSENGILVFYKI